MTDQTKNPAETEAEKAKAAEAEKAKAADAGKAKAAEAEKAKAADAGKAKAKSDGGPYVVAAFNDAQTGERIAKGDPLPDHIAKDKKRVEDLKARGILSDEEPQPLPAGSPFTHGGLLSVGTVEERSKGRLASEGFGKTEG